MSTIYLLAAQVIKHFLAHKVPLTSLIYSDKASARGVSVPEKQRGVVYAVALGTLRYKSVLEQLLHTTELLKGQGQLYDYLLSSQQRIEGGGALKRLIVAHSNQLRSTLVRMKIKAGACDNEGLLPAPIRHATRMPRYVRINTLKTTDQLVHNQLKQEGYLLQQNDYDPAIWDRNSVPIAPAADGESKAKSSPHTDTSMFYYVDSLIPHLLIFSPSADIHLHPLYEQGVLIFQDKASCMPAAIVNPCSTVASTPRKKFHVIDATAAPGNKTTQLLAIGVENLSNFLQSQHSCPHQTNGPSATPSSSSTPSQNGGAHSATTTATSSPPSSSTSQHQSKHNRQRPARHSADNDADENTDTLPASSYTGTGKKYEYYFGGGCAACKSSGQGQEYMYHLEACEVDPSRFEILNRMMKKALPNSHSNTPPTSTKQTHNPSTPCLPSIRVTLNNLSFLALDPHSAAYADVDAILLDPTCSGSGMLHRIEQFYKHYAHARDGKQQSTPSDELDGSSDNVRHLAEFQQNILLHAMSFPNVRIISYSTCSVHVLEDEDVVSAVLATEVGRQFELLPALPAWHRRGQGVNGLPPEQASMCVRSAGAADGMNGFFVAGFRRKLQNGQSSKKLTCQIASGSSSGGIEASCNKRKQTSPAASSQQAVLQPSQSKKQKLAADTSSTPTPPATTPTLLTDQPSPSASTSTLSGSSPSTLTNVSHLGSQTVRNKKKREKAKLKKAQQQQQQTQQQA